MYFTTRLDGRGLLRPVSELLRTLLIIYNITSTNTLSVAYFLKDFRGMGAIRAYSPILAASARNGGSFRISANAGLTAMFSTWNSCSAADFSSHLTVCA